MTTKDEKEFNRIMTKNIRSSMRIYKNLIKGKKDSFFISPVEASKLYALRALINNTLVVCEGTNHSEEFKYVGQVTETFIRDNQVVYSTGVMQHEQSKRRVPKSK